MGMRIVLALIILCIVGCGKKTSTPEESSGLFQNWTNSTEPQLSLSGGHFGSNNVTITKNGTDCKCEIAISGFDDMGDLEIRLCTLSDGLTAHATCTGLEQTYEYECDGTKLELCESGGSDCSTYY